jgi:hypothetical protein
MSDFFTPFGETELDELVRVQEAGADGLHQRDFNPRLFPLLVRHDLIETRRPDHYIVTRRGMIMLERHHRL